MLQLNLQKSNELCAAITRSLFSCAGVNRTKRCLCHYTVAVAAFAQKKKNYKLPWSCADSSSFQAKVYYRLYIWKHHTAKVGLIESSNYSRAATASSGNSTRKGELWQAKMSAHSPASPLSTRRILFQLPAHYKEKRAQGANGKTIRAISQGLISRNLVLIEEKRRNPRSNTHTYLAAWRFRITTKTFLTF